MKKYTLRDATLLVGMIASLTFASVTMAGEFNEVDGVAIRGYDPVSYVVEQKAERGRAEFAGAYKGSTFHFKSAAHRDLFLASPEKYAPQYGGYCAFGVSRGYKAGISPDAFSVIDGKLYLNYNADVKATWSKDAPGYIGKADAQWSAVERTTKVIR
jgi:YHS domain-containing protein